jgi:hypothetical protein
MDQQDDASRSIVLRILEQVDCIYPLVLKRHAIIMESLFMNVFGLIFFQPLGALAQTDSEMAQMRRTIWKSVATPLLTWLFSSPFSNETFEFFTFLTVSLGSSRAWM